MTDVLNNVIKKNFIVNDHLSVFRNKDKDPAYE